jgi:hypothetical protein
VKLEGSVTLPAESEKVWTLLLDPTFLAEILPGCRELQQSGEDQFTGILEAKVGPIGSAYTTKFSILEKKPPESYRLQLEGSGKGGFVRADTFITLQANGAQTVMNYSGEASIGGTIAKIGQRLVESAAKMIIDKGFKTLREKVAERVK